MLSAESGKPIIVFMGSSLALISSSLVGVLIGKWISNKISPSKFAFFTGLLMIIISLFLAYDIIKSLHINDLNLLLSTFLNNIYCRIRRQNSVSYINNEWYI